jgi:hypothetical protein
MSATPPLDPPAPPGGSLAPAPPRGATAELVGFLRRPQPQLPPPLPGHRIRTYLGIWSACLVVAWFAGIVAGFAADAAGASNELAEVDAELLAVMAVLFAPLLEEVAFRLPITTFNPVKLAVAAVVASLFVPVAAPLARVGVGLALVVAVAVLAGVPALRERLETRWARRFRWVVYGCSAIFGLAHVSNWNVDWNALTVALLPVMVAPQMGVGLLLAYARVKLGLIGAILVHAAYNGVLVALLLSASALAPAPG